jgi:hypothetical protein
MPHKSRTFGILKILTRFYTLHDALNAKFQHFIPRFNKISSFYRYIERGVWGWKEAQRQGDFMNNLNIYIHLRVPKHYIRPPFCKCIWQICTLVKCICKKLCTHQQCKCKYKKVKHINVNHLHFHKTYMQYIRLLTLTHTTLVFTYIKCKV